MSSRCSVIFRERSKPLEPIVTGVEPVLRKLESVRAVLFDIYGTLFVSGSGDIGVLRDAACERALAEALGAVGASNPGDLLDESALQEAARVGMESFFATIEDFHEQSRSAGVEYPEVDIIAVWSQVVTELGISGLVNAKSSLNIRQLAVEYESRANPVWPMPGVVECLEELRRGGLRLGIVSNAQFYTRELFPALLNKEPEELGFEPGLQYYSYQYGWGKPGIMLFELAAEALRLEGIEPDSVVFVGNDMLNDILPAKQVGFRAALFAGDERSLRLRDDDPRVAGTNADLILSELGQLGRCIM
ncbi:MAG: HAD hydrolase-like protein [Pirellulales bacterium]|nr:HAD hydrolase-like protein [Pirellulales bacterium]